MAFSGLLLAFLLGYLAGVLCMAISWTKDSAKKRAIDRQYETLLWWQIEQLRQLLQTNNDLLADNTALRQRYLELKQKHEKMLAALN